MPQLDSDSTNQSRRIALGMTLVSILLLSGCQAPVPVPMSDLSWCAEVKNELTHNEVGWPVGNRALDSNYLNAVQETFTSYAPKAADDLEIAARGWLQGFVAARPFLETGDQDAFNREVSDEMKQQLQLANIAISNICQWEEW